MRPPFDLSQLGATFKLGFADDARRAATPHTVVCAGLSEDDLGQQRFCEALQARRAWISTHCKGAHEIEPIRDAQQRLTGRLFRFSDPDEAFWFKVTLG